MDRRDFLLGSGVLLGAAALQEAVRETAGAQAHVDGRYQPVHTPNGSTLEYRMVDGVKVFHLIAEEFEHEFAPGLRATCWGYNGQTPGPTIEVVEGDRVRFYVTNRLAEATTVHWHGLVLPNGMDGVSGLNQVPILPGKTFRYEFQIEDPGTFMYHPHFDEMTQMALGMMGMFIAHPRRPTRPVARDYVIMLNEWSVPIGASRPNPLEMVDFNVLTMNSKVFPGTEALVAETGERIRIRFGNLSGMDNHPIHLHGPPFEIVGSDGGMYPRSAVQPHTTVLVPTGSCRVVEVVCREPGDWAMHCHMTHHTMTQMGHNVPNMTGTSNDRLRRWVSPQVRGYMPMGSNGMGAMPTMQMPQPPNSLPMRGGPGPFSNIDMGGMFTVLKVRNELGEGEVGWYEHPEGTVAREATAAELGADGIDV
ncbi:MAG: FtsP/CotA-like multicopper oxidase with cupredoxin domain [Polyangiales bacterium]|jgi:FtsP/CotA-like multicopper oxidase with cupredoxin domain